MTLWVLFKKNTNYCKSRLKNQILIIDSFDILKFTIWFAKEGYS